MTRAGALAAAALVAGCAAPPRPGPASTGPRAASIPAGCEANLAGTYRHADDDSFRYDATDDGRTLTLEVRRSWPDAGSPADGGSSARVVLRRSAQGFVGETRTPRPGREGTSCEVALPAQVTACLDAGIRLRIVERLRVDAACAPAEAAEPARGEHLLLRLGADGGR